VQDRASAGRINAVSERWYKQAVIYCLDVETFQDSDGDGIGDLRGLLSRLDYLARLGVTCLWLNPVHPTPNRDDGYDVADYYGIDPRIGSLGDFAELVHEAGNRGIRIMMDLVVNHTSDEHSWFRSARADASSSYRDWYIWSDREPAGRRQGMVFPGEQQETWTFDQDAGAWYFHRFHAFEPDLNWANPAVQAEIKRVIGFWLQLGVAGFRIDAAPSVITLEGPEDQTSRQDFTLLTELRGHVSWLAGDAVLLAEANVGLDQLPEYFSGPGGSGDRLHMLFDFRLNSHLMLALARGEAEPVIETLRSTPPIPAWGQWATFLRNHDEVDLSGLTAEQRQQVFAVFGPQETMRIYGRGIRRRLAPMLGGYPGRTRMAYSLQFTLPGTPVLRYGEELGMGEDLALSGRTAVRTPMQWTDEASGGFSTAGRDQLVRPVIRGGEYGCETVNVLDQRRDRSSLLSWFETMIRTLRESPEVGTGTCTLIDVPLPPHVLAHRCDGPTGSMLFLHNLADSPATCDLAAPSGAGDTVVEVFADQDYPPPDVGLHELELAGYGYRWLRLDRQTGSA
jgi:maltose alpha-D-glucosyltransferase/alpha-amylase